MGVAQGSILSAKLFLVYINDLPACISADRVCLFADDTSIIIKANDPTTVNYRTEVCISEATEWFNSNKLRINLAKTKTILISTKPNQEADTIKFLGLYINSTLKWGDHVDYLQRKLATAIFMIRRIRKISTYTAARTAYFSNFHSVASYGILIWGNSRQLCRSNPCTAEGSTTGNGTSGLQRQLQTTIQAARHINNASGVHINSYVIRPQ